MSKLKDILLRLAREASTHRRVDVAAYFTTDFVLHDAGVGALSRGLEGAQTMIDGVLAFAPDLKMEIVDMVEEGDRVAVRWSASGTREGEHLVASLIAIYRFTGERIAEDWGMSVRRPWP